MLLCGRVIKYRRGHTARLMTTSATAPRYIRAHNVLYAFHMNFIAIKSMLECEKKNISDMKSKHKLSNRK